MIKIIDKTKDGFDTMVCTDKWKMAIITYSEDYDQLRIFKRHTTSDEAFILIEGKATIITYEDGLKMVEMQKNKAYVIEKNTWHHVKVDKDTKLVVVENSDVTRDNTQSIKKEDLMI